MTTSSNFWHLNIPNVKKAIAEYTDPKTRCRLSMCSKADKALVESLPFSFKSIDVFVKDPDRPHRIWLNLKNGSRNIYDFENTSDVVQCLIYHLKSPNTCEHLDFHDSHPKDPPQTVMSQLIDQLIVQEITPKIKNIKWVNTPGDVFIKFFTMLDVDYLEGCYVHSTQETRAQIDRLVETDQWKKLKVVNINGVMDPTWCVEDVLDKQKFNLYIDEIVPAGVRRIVQAFRRRNHPVGSCFHVLFQSKFTIDDVYPEHGEVQRESNKRFYLKTFPMPNEEYELRVQLFQYSYRNQHFIMAVNGIVTPKSQEFEPCDVWSIIHSHLHVVA